MAGPHPLRLPVARNAQLLLHHSRRNPALTGRASGNTHGPLPVLARRAGGLPVSLHVPRGLPVVQGQTAQSVQRVAEHVVRVVTDAAWQAEEAAQFAEAAGRGARRGNLVATSLGAFVILLGIAVLAARHINTRTNVEMTSVAAALRQLNATQREINDRLNAQQAPQAALVAPTGQGSIMPVAPTAVPPVTVPVAPIGPAVPVDIKPLPPVTWSAPNEATHPVPPNDLPVQRSRFIRNAPSNLVTSEAPSRTAG